MSDPVPTAAILGPKQKKLLGWAVTAASISVLCVCLAAAFRAMAHFFSTFGGVIWPLIAAGVLSLLLEPVCSFLERRLRLSRVPAIIVLYLIVVSVLSGIALTLLPALWEQLLQLGQTIPKLRIRILDFIALKFPSVDVWLKDGGLLHWMKTHTQQLSKAVTGSAPLLLGAKTQIINFIAKITGLALVPVYLFYLLDLRRDFTKDLERESGFLPPSIRRDLIFLIRQFLDILISFFRGQFLVGLSLGVIMATGFGIIGLHYGLLLGLLIGLGNIIPYLGTMLGLAIVLPLAFFQDGGGIKLLGASAIVFIIAQATEGYFLTPRIMGKTTGLHPMVIILSVFFWGVAFDGLIGMVLAIPLTAFFVVLWRLIRDHHLPNRSA